MYLTPELGLLSKSENIYFKYLKICAHVKNSVLMAFSTDQS